MADGVSHIITYFCKHIACVLLLAEIIACDTSGEGETGWRPYPRRGYGYTSQPGRYGSNQYSNNYGWSKYQTRAYGSYQGRYGNNQYQYTSKYGWSNYQRKPYSYAPGQYQRYSRRPYPYNGNREMGLENRRSSWSRYQSGGPPSYPRKEYSQFFESTSSSSSSVSEVKESVRIFNKVPIFYDRDTIMDVFDIARVGRERLVTDMMANYEHICLAKPDVPTPAPMKRKPFIVIEGNHKPSRKMLAHRLAELMQGRHMNMTRKCLEPYVDKFPKGTKLRRAFFGLALYASEYKVRQLWDKSLAVVMDGYWMDQTAHVIAWLFGSRNLSLPEPTNRIYSWPGDLMQPDILFYIQTIVNVSPLEPKWMSLVPQVYRKIKSPKVVILTLKESINKTADAMHDYIKKNLKDRCDVSGTTPPPESERDEYDNPFGHI